MKILVIGYGSMGRRRIRLIKKIDPMASFVCVDSNEARRLQAKQNGNMVYSTLDEALEEEYTCAFICTSPGYHSDIILKLVDKGIHTFTEINLVDDDYDIIVRTAAEKSVKVFMSSTMLYNKQIRAIEQKIANVEGTLNYIYHIGQYLPDWHPWESYKNYFISKKETNGCREILAIQLPWIIKTFGKISNTSKLMKKSTELDIQYDDTYFIQLLHENNTFGTFVCDVVSRKATTYLEIFGENIHITWNGLPDGLCYYDFATKSMKKMDSYDKIEHMDEYADTIIEDEYEDEIRAFFDWIIKDIAPLYTIEDDKYTISIINEIEGK